MPGESKSRGPAIYNRNHHLRRPDTDMEDIRGSLSRLKKDIKHRLSGSKHKGDKPGTGGRVEKVEGSGSLLQPEADVATRGTHG